MIVDLLIQEVSPKQLCATLSLCPAMTLEVKNTPYCGVCLIVAQELSQVVTQNSTEQQIEQALEQVCSFLPSQYTKECDELVKQYTPMIIEMLKKEVDPKELCAMLKLCPAKQQTTPAKLPTPVKESPACELCELMAEQLETALSDKATQNQIEFAVSQVCNFLPASYKTECESMVHEYGQKIIDFLVKEAKPKTLCAHLRMCPGKETTLTVKASYPYCPICTMVAAKLEKFVTQKSSKAQIELVLDGICAILPSQYATECDNYVAQYTPMIVDLLIQEVSPKQLCATLSLCPAMTLEVKNTPYCGVCLIVAQELSQVVTQNSTEQQIEQALEQVCSFLPSQYTKECDELVKQYTPMIIEMLKKEVDPKELCAMLKLCPAKQQTTPLKTTTPVKESPVCEVCELMVAQLDSALSDKSTQNEIEFALKQVCNYLPASYQTECESMVQEYTPMMIEYLIKEASPKQLCEMLKLCPAKQAAKKVEGKSCDLCHEVVGKLQKFLHANSTPSEIEHVVDNVCNLILQPKYLKSECEQMVREYTPDMINMVIRGATVENICNYTGICGAKKVVVREM